VAALASVRSAHEPPAAQLQSVRRRPLLLNKFLLRCAHATAFMALASGISGCFRGQPRTVTGEWYGSITEVPGWEVPSDFLWAHSFRLHQGREGSIRGEWITHLYGAPELDFRARVAGSVTGDSLALVLPYECDYFPRHYVYIGRVDTVRGAIIGWLDFLREKGDSLTLSHEPDSVILGLWDSLPMSDWLCLPDSSLGPR